MDEGRNNRTVERRMKDALKHDRARIQVGRISHFGLLEMSRQRIRTSVLESSTEKCPVCGGSGHVRSVSSVALQLLRAIEETLIKGATHNLIVRTRSEVALYVLNHKRAHLHDLEDRFRITITISADPTVNAQVSYIVDRGEQVHTVEAAKILAAAAQPPLPSMVEADEDVLDAAAGSDVEDEAEDAGESAIGDVTEAPELAHGDGGGQAPRGDGEREGGERRRPPAAPAGRGRGGEPREPREARRNLPATPRPSLRSRTRITMTARPRKPVSTSSRHAKAALPAPKAMFAGAGGAAAAAVAATGKAAMARRRSKPAMAADRAPKCSTRARISRP